jgi:hypothetical protein
MTIHRSTGQQYRRKIARAFRRRINQSRQARERIHCGWGSTLMGDVASAARIDTQELRSIVFGTRDADAVTIGAIAKALGLKAEHQFALVASVVAQDDGSRTAS